MKRIVDFSDYQAGLDLPLVAQAVDGAWAKAGDWSYMRAHPGRQGDDVHLPAIEHFTSVGVPIGSYLFVRPGWTDPKTQIDTWRANTPETTLAPMIDLEVPGTLSAGSLTDWVDEALARTTEVFGAVPVLYWSLRFQRDNGMGVPATNHIPMVAEYHRGYSMFAWADLSSWESRAYSAYGGPGVPSGYGLHPLDLIWQFTSSAQIPGMPTLVDMSFCVEERWQQIQTGSLGTSSIATPQEDFLVALPQNVQERIAQLIEQIANDTASTNWHLGNFPPTAGREAETISARVRDTQAAAHAAVWHLGNFEPTAGREGETVATRTGQILERVNHAPDPVMLPTASVEKVIDVPGSLKSATFKQLLDELAARSTNKA